MDSRMQDSHKSFLIKDLLGDVLRPGAVAAIGMSNCSRMLYQCVAD